MRHLHVKDGPARRQTKDHVALGRGVFEALRDGLVYLTSLENQE